MFEHFQRLNGPAPTDAAGESAHPERGVEAATGSAQLLRLQHAALESTANAVVITNREGTILWTNPAFTSLTGYDAAAAAGRTPRILKSGAHSDAHYLGLWKTILAGRTWRGEFTNRRKDGSLYCGEQTITPVRDDGGNITHFVGVMNDVTARRRAEDARAATQRQLQHLLDHTPAVIYGATIRNGEVVPHVISQTITRMLGFSAEEALGSDWWREQLHPDDRDRAIAAIRETITHEASVIQYRLRHRDGTYRWVEDNCQVVRGADGTPSEFIGVLTDFTERKRAEEVLRGAVRSQTTRRQRRVALELGLVLASAALAFAGGATFNWFENLFGVLSRDAAHPYLENLAGTFGVLLLGVFVFSFRRFCESRAETISQHNIATALHTLHAELDTRVRQRTAELARANETLRREAAERRRVEEALRQSEERYRRLIDTSPSGIFLNVDGRFAYVNRSFCEIVGARAAEQLIGTPVLDRIHPDEHARIRERSARAEQGMVAPLLDERYLRLDGSVVDVEVTATRVDFEGQRAFQVLVNDITARKRTEQALEEQREQWQTLVNASASALYVIQDDEIVFANAATARLFGARRETLLGRNIFTLVHEDHHELIRARRRLALAQDQPMPLVELKGRRDDGVVIDYESTSVRFHFRGRSALLVEARDISARTRAEAEIREAESRFRQLAENVHEVFWLSHPAKSEMLYVSPAYERIWGRSCASLYADPLSWLEAVHPDDRGRVVAAIVSQARGEYDEQYRVIRPDGTERWIRDRAFPVRDDRGQVNRVAGIAEDITEHKCSLLHLELQNEVTRLLAEGGSLGRIQAKLLQVLGRSLHWEFGEIWSVDRVARQLRCSEDWHDGTRDLAKLAAAARDDGFAPARDLVGQVRSVGRPLVSLDLEHETGCARRELAVAAGFRSWIGFPIALRHETLGVVGFFCTRTERPDPTVLALLATLGAQLGQFVEREQLAEQFRQAQKMEAIGTLAGGIAHDFNNIIAAISGYTELALMDVTDGPAVRQHLAAVLQGAGRATGLVRQILAFSRQQEHERRPIELRHIVSEALNLLRATVPASIDFEFHYEPDLPAVLADATQVHQVIMNLGTNAWHAMRERAGHLTVRIERCTIDEKFPEPRAVLKPGHYVRLTMSDTGCGMDEGVLSRIFEPFFTTKAPGEGTGLGLSVVHGIMQGHEGAVTVQSQREVGTTFQLYFPACKPAASAEVGRGGNIPVGRGERVLLVDDEVPLTMMARMVLERLGYAVDVFNGPHEALRAVRAKPDSYDLVITDLTMPLMSGVELAQQLRTIRADLPIVVATGHSATLTVARARELGIRDLLSKPISVQALGTVIARVLAQEKQASP